MTVMAGTRLTPVATTGKGYTSTGDRRMRAGHLVVDQSHHRGAYEAGADHINSIGQPAVAASQVHGMRWIGSTATVTADGMDLDSFTTPTEFSTPDHAPLAPRLGLWVGSSVCSQASQGAVVIDWVRVRRGFTPTPVVTLK